MSLENKISLRLNIDVKKEISRKVYLGKANGLDVILKSTNQIEVESWRRVSSIEGYEKYFPTFLGSGRNDSLGDYIILSYFSKDTVGNEVYRIREDKKLALDIAMKTAKALKMLNMHGITYFDSLENNLLISGNDVKLTDFDFTPRLKSSSEEINISKRSKIRLGELVGFLLTGMKPTYSGAIRVKTAYFKNEELNEATNNLITELFEASDTYDQIINRLTWIRDNLYKETSNQKTSPVKKKTFRKYSIPGLKELLNYAEEKGKIDEVNSLLKSNEEKTRIYPENLDKTFIRGTRVTRETLNELMSILELEESERNKIITDYENTLKNTGGNDLFNYSPETGKEAMTREEIEFLLDDDEISIDEGEWDNITPPKGTEIAHKKLESLWMTTPERKSSSSTILSFQISRWFKRLQRNK